MSLLVVISGHVVQIGWGCSSLAVKSFALYLAEFFKCQKKIKNKIAMVSKGMNWLGLLVLLLLCAVCEGNKVYVYD